MLMQASCIVKVNTAKFLDEFLTSMNKNIKNKNAKKICNVLDHRFGPSSGKW